MGNVVAPDTYTISSLASPLNVLYSAGGPNESGSYRNIKIIRNGTEILKIDLYDYFTSGKLDPFSLRDQDIIFVPSYENRIFVKGEFKNIGLFETNENENILDLLKYTGGIKPFGVKDRLFIKSSDGLNRKISDIQEIDFSNFILNDGDIVEARALTQKYNNMVTIEGAVSIPGDYSISDIQNIKQLISKAGGLREDAINRAYLIRKSNGIESEIISFEISNSDNFFLKNEDRLIISSNIDVNRSKNVSIRGEVFSPNTYSFFNGMTLMDLILIAKGLTLEGDLDNIYIYRSTLDEDRKNPIETIKVSLGSDLQNMNQINNINLKENDLVIVRKKLGIQEKEIISVDGLVKFPGTYNIRDNKYSFFDLIGDFGGFLDDANLDGVKIIRSANLNTDNKINLSTINTQNTIEIGINVKKIIESNGSNSKYNVILKSSDKIVVPPIDNTIEVYGAIQQAAAITYTNSLTTISAINSAGGFSENANKRDVYVVYQNGNIASTKSFLFFNNYPKLKAGSKIIVPEKSIEKNKTSVGEIVGYTTSLVSIIALIKSL
jgi:protein involved in polysaccharide export with SLBB domain